MHCLFTIPCTQKYICEYICTNMSVYALRAHLIYVYACILFIFFFQLDTHNEFGCIFTFVHKLSSNIMRPWKIILKYSKEWKSIVKRDKGEREGIIVCIVTLSRASQKKQSPSYIVCISHKTTFMTNDSI